MTSNTAPALFNPEQALEFADDLIRQLAANIDDPGAVADTLGHWAEVLEGNNFARVCIAAVRTVFLDCLTRVDSVPDGALAFSKEEQR